VLTFGIPDHCRYFAARGRGARPGRWYNEAARAGLIMCGMAVWERTWTFLTARLGRLVNSQPIANFLQRNELRVGFIFKFLRLGHGEIQKKLRAVQ